MIVAAIDFGTCNTKMAFAHLTHGKDAQIVVMDDWENAPEALTTPTSILIDHTGKVLGYGYEAEEMFRALPSDEAKICYLFKNFKMALHKKEVRKVVALYTKAFLYNSFYSSRLYSPNMLWETVIKSITK